jgi:DNA-binding response OmpR family regulator
VKTVLILEDDASVLALIHQIVEQDGYTVLDATTAEEAFIRFEENDAIVDLLIADVTLPGRSGVRTALELRDLLPYLKIVITSGYPSDHWDRLDAAELEQLPSDSVEVLQKPFSLTSLLDTIHRLIGWPQVMAPVQKMKAAL